MATIRTMDLLAVSPCLQNSCPRWLSPSDGAKLLASLDFDYDEKVASRLTEVIENFGLQILSAIKQAKTDATVTVADLEDYVRNMALVG